MKTATPGVPSFGTVGFRCHRCSWLTASYNTQKPTRLRFHRPTFQTDMRNTYSKNRQRRTFETLSLIICSSVWHSKMSLDYQWPSACHWIPHNIKRVSWRQTFGYHGISFITEWPSRALQKDYCSAPAPLCSRALKRLVYFCPISHLCVQHTGSSFKFTPRNLVLL